MPAFIQFIWGNRDNRTYLYSSLIISTFLLAIFKIIYPYPNLVMDSYFYIRAAANNADVNAWPIGYSRFLQFIGMFTHSSLVLVIIQYFLLQLSLLTLFFTLRLFFKLGHLASWLLVIFFFANPLFLYTANLIMADTLFIALSVFWITQLLWIIYKPRPWMILTHTMLLFMTFAVRYNALYYPIVAALAFLLSRQRLALKCVGIALPALLIICFVAYTSKKMETYCGVRQFSPFGGWKLANDALYMYAHVLPDAADSVPSRFRTLDIMVRHYFDSSHDPADLLRHDTFHGSPYMFRYRTPLMEYMQQVYGPDPRTVFLNFEKWSRMGPFYTGYGSYLIRKYPLAFTRWFLWPNLQRFAVPPREIYMAITPFFLHDQLGPEATQWFGLTNLTVENVYIRLRLNIFSYFPMLFGLLHLCFMLSLIGFLLLKGWTRADSPYRYCLLTMIFFWICDFCFNLFAAAIVMRYQIFMVVLEFSLSLYFLEYIYRHIKNRSVRHKSNQENLAVIN